jgi:hypothetical protein
MSCRRTQDTKTTPSGNVKSRCSKIKRKTELEAFSRYGLTYIVDEYLPTKLEQKPKEKKGFTILELEILLT